jgi:hypothetical protein
MIKRREMRLNGEWQLDGKNQVYELRMATLTSRVGNQIFLICSLKSYMTFFCDF